MPTDWNKIAQDTQRETDAHFKGTISSLTSLKDSDIAVLITETGISKLDLIEVLKVIDDTSRSNESKAQAIANINNGIRAIVKMAERII